MTREELLSQADKHATILEKDFRALAGKVIRDLAAALREEMAEHREAAEWQKAKAEWIDVAARTLAAQLETVNRLEGRLASAEAALTLARAWDASPIDGPGNVTWQECGVAIRQHFAKYQEKP